MISKIVKRDGRCTEFELHKIADAINKAFEANTKRDHTEYSNFLAERVLFDLEEQSIETPTVEQIQDSVERVLIDNGHVRIAKAYIV